MKKIVALPLLLALGLSVAACSKQNTTENLADGNIVLNDETGTDNFQSSDDLGNNLSGAGNVTAEGAVNAQ